MWDLQGRTQRSRACWGISPLSLVLLGGHHQGESTAANWFWRQQGQGQSERRGTNQALAALLRVWDVTACPVSFVPVPPGPLPPGSPVGVLSEAMLRVGSHAARL